MGWFLSDRDLRHERVKVNDLRITYLKSAMESFQEIIIIRFLISELVVISPWNLLQHDFVHLSSILQGSLMLIFAATMVFGLC